MYLFFYYIFINFRKSFQMFFFLIGKHLTILGSQGTNGEQGTWKSFLLL